MKFIQDLILLLGTCKNMIRIITLNNPKDLGLINIRKHVDPDHTAPTGAV